MHRPEPAPSPPPGRPAAPPEARLQLIDLAAVVVGYSLAAVLFRAFWPRSQVSPHLVAFASGFYLWLGMAMSGPLLLFRRRGEAAPEGPARAGAAASAADRRTWAENAWLVIGVYWIIMGALVLPGRLHAFRFGDTILFGAMPLVASVAFRMFGRRPVLPASAEAWTHLAAVALIVTWPFAWLCLIVVGQAIL
ncbi:hypothetical protein OJF2_47170 [Aquisphaera giovannonii]|uniref:Uncharacterized protein n=1 Tax=Aquisphaera giovannonii TaxID=406548 RepID=A0A5B9W729_9BACT|nr:hypothetical protein [Aquisphaera giovannonii]QEH36157.1 hypothetical protein OJF2_47170 [Aquisphaera giovannonii]